MVWAGNTGTICSAIAVAVATAPIATTTTSGWRLLQDVLLEFLGGSGRWAGPETPEVQWSEACDCLTFVVTHYYILHNIITLTITTYYYVFNFYTVDTALLHIITMITLLFIMDYYKNIITYYYMIVIWLFHDYYMIITLLLRSIMSLLHLVLILPIITLFSLSNLQMFPLHQNWPLATCTKAGPWLGLSWPLTPIVSTEWSKPR